MCTLIVVHCETNGFENIDWFGVSEQYFVSIKNLTAKSNYTESTHNKSLNAKVT